MSISPHLDQLLGLRWIPLPPLRHHFSSEFPVFSGSFSPKLQRVITFWVSTMLHCLRGSRVRGTRSQSLRVILPPRVSEAQVQLVRQFQHNWAPPPARQPHTDGPGRISDAVRLPVVTETADLWQHRFYVGTKLRPHGGWAPHSLHYFLSSLRGEKAAFWAERRNNKQQQQRIENGLVTLTPGAVPPLGAPMTDGSHQSSVGRRRASAGLSLLMRAAHVQCLSNS